MRKIKGFLVVMIVSMVLSSYHIDGLEEQAAAIRDAGISSTASALNAAGLSQGTSDRISYYTFQAGAFLLSIPWKVGQFAAERLGRG